VGRIGHRHRMGDLPVSCHPRPDPVRWPGSPHRLPPKEELLVFRTTIPRTFAGASLRFKRASFLVATRLLRVFHGPFPGETLGSLPALPRLNSRGVFGHNTPRSNERIWILKVLADDVGNDDLNRQTLVPPMKFLFSSAEFSIIQRIRQTLAGFGIRHEIRGIDPGASAKTPRYVELWVGRGNEFSHAVQLFSSELNCVKVQPAVVRR